MSDSSATMEANVRAKPVSPEATTTTKPTKASNTSQQSPDVRIMRRLYLYLVLFLYSLLVFFATATTQQTTTTTTKPPAAAATHTTTADYLIAATTEASVVKSSQLTPLGSQDSARRSPDGIIIIKPSPPDEPAEGGNKLWLPVINEKKPAATRTETFPLEPKALNSSSPSSCLPGELLTEGRLATPCERRSRRELEPEEDSQQETDLQPQVATMQQQSTSDMIASASVGHGFSLAKRKLLSKTAPSMLNSAVINGKVSLPCDISPANSDDSVALILWYKDDSLAPIYTIDARKANGLDKARTSLGEAYANRASFNMKTKPAQLQLESIKQEDEGEYRCRVDFKRGRTVNTIISLRVIVLPDDVRIVAPNRPHEKLHDPIGPFNEGSELALLCIATGGKPRPQITWRRDFNVIDETYQHLDKEGTSNELKIPSLNKNHLLSRFTCQASNNNLTSPMQDSITLDLNLKPSEISLRQIYPQEPLVVGQSATFECLTHGSRPQATIHWIFQGVRQDTPMNVDQKQTTSRITLTIQRSFNQQPLTCVAENPRMPQTSAIRQTIKLDVHYPPQLSIKLEPSTGHTPMGQQPMEPNRPLNSDNLLTDQANSRAGSGNGTLAGRDLVTHLQEGNDIYLTCLMDANPRPMKPILWRFNGRPLAQQQGSSMIVMNNQSLVLRKVVRQQSGSYTCDSSNQHGTGSSQPMELIIRHAPVCKTDDVLVFEAAVGQTVSIDCNVVANPSRSVHYSWFLAPDERNLTNWLQRDAGLDDQIDESSSKLRFKIKDDNGFALIKCKAKNEVGLQQRACLFRVVQAPAPALRHNCRLASAVSRGLQVKCEPSEQLKMEEFEMVPRASSDGRLGSLAGAGSNSLSRWFDKETIRQQQQQQTNSATQVSHNQEAGSGGHHHASLVDRPPNQRLAFPANWLLVELYRWQNSTTRDEETQRGADSTLASYVIVGFNNQLASIKSMIEENRLFSSNPRSVYYVAARPLDNENSSASGQRFDNLLLLPTPPSATADDLAPLAGSFLFTVPNLEPATPYRLHIYGQNLANKTRDCLVVGGETLGEESFPKSPSVAVGPVFGANLIAGHQTKMAGDQPEGHSGASLETAAGGQHQLQQQKSIVMRSDDDDQQTSGNQFVNQQQQGDSGNPQTERSSTVGKLTGGAELSLGEKLQQLGAFRDYVLAYAKQRPLLATSLVFSCLLLVLVLFFWLSSALISAGRKTSSPEAGDDMKVNQRRLSSSSGDRDLAQSKGSSSSSSSAGDANPGANNAARGSHLFKSSSDGSYGSSGPISPPNQNSAEPLIKGILQMDQTYRLQEQPQQRQEKYGTVYTIGPMDLSDASNNVNSIYGRHQKQPAHCHFAANSLDRREMHSAEPVYLAEQSDRAGLLQLHGRVGSIDRRLPGGGFIGYAANNKQQPLLLTELGRLEHGQGLYMGEEVQANGDIGLQTDEQQAAASSYYDGSFSSNECHSLEGAQVGGNGGHLRTRSQRVAFDLSNQQQQQQQIGQHLCPKEQHLVDGRRSRRSRAASPQQQHNGIAADGQQQTVGGKGSDSGGSNSGNTADSGLESPATGETNSLSYHHAPNCPTHLMMAQLQQQGAPNSFHGQTPASSAPATSAGPNELHLIECNASLDSQDLYNHSLNSSQAHQGNLVMLMELSPGSQESSTLMHSVDSYGEIIQQTCPVNGAGQNIRFLRNNHQMATSFTTTNHHHGESEQSHAQQQRIPGHGSQSKTNTDNKSEGPIEFERSFG